MILFPFHKYQLKTDFSPSEVSQKLSENISLDDKYDDNKQYEGSVNYREFEINTRTLYAYGEASWITNLGQIEEAEKGSKIYIRVYLGLVFYMFYLGFPLIFLGIGIYHVVNSNFSDFESLAFTAIFAFVIYGGGLLAYRNQVNQAKEFFTRVLDAKVEN